MHQLFSNLNKMILAGLGNIGEKYKNTRHNAGFIFLDYLSGEKEWEDNKNLHLLYKRHTFVSHHDRIVMELIKPTTMMNDSGQALSQFLNFYKKNLSELILIFDDLDLELGNWKYQHGKGPRIHNGLNSVEESLGTTNFNRIRVGIQNAETRKVEDHKIIGADYVLMPFTDDEIKILTETVFPQIKESLGLIVLG